MVIRFLNYAFFYEGIMCLDELTADIAERFLKRYGLCVLPDDDEKQHRAKDTVSKCIGYVFDFLLLLIEDRKGKIRMKKKDLYREVVARDKYGKAYVKKVPRFDVEYIDIDRLILRDIPNAAFDIMYDHFIRKHPELLGVFMLCAFVGLRPSEACNVRREDSPFGPGIRFITVNGEIRKIKIDLTKELKLRSDAVSVGGIKRERTQEVCPVFIDAFMQTYDYYIKYLEKQNYEKEFAPFSVNRSGKALTYASFKNQFNKIIKDELVPIFLKSDDPDVVIFGQLCLEHSLGPHALRHWFTVQLVLSGIDDPASLQFYRGDKNPMSAITYLNNKGELEKMYKRINDEVYEYQYWKAKKMFGEEEDD